MMMTQSQGKPTSSYRRCSESGSHTSASPVRSQNGHGSQQHRSTKGASKQRRDHINNEISRLRDLLPLAETVRDRLFQLQVMSLACVYIRKHRYMPHVIGDWYGPQVTHENSHIHHSQSQPVLHCKNTGNFWRLPKNMIQPALNGFLIMMKAMKTQEEVMSQGDNLADIIDTRDVSKMRSELAAGPPSVQTGAFPQEKHIVLRLNCSRTTKRQLQYQKILLIRGHYMHPSEYYRALVTLASTPNANGTGAILNSSHPAIISPVFAGFCTLLLNPDNVDNVAPPTGGTDVFRTVHLLDMRFIYIDHIGSHYLGWSNEDFVDEKNSDAAKSLSWYSLLHPADLHHAATRHRHVSVDREPAAMLLARLQTKAGTWLWTHCILALRTSANIMAGCVGGGSGAQGAQAPAAVGPSDPVFIQATHQVLSDSEAQDLSQQHTWLYASRHHTFRNQQANCGNTAGSNSNNNTDTVSSHSGNSGDNLSEKSNHGGTNWPSANSNTGVLGALGKEPTTSSGGAGLGTTPRRRSC